MESLVYTKKILIFGCGNILFGDDGFGPEVVNRLNSAYSLPGTVLALDAGTGIRDLIFDLLLVEKKPELIWVIDAVTIQGKNNGDIFEIDLSDVPGEKMSDFSLHQSPSSNLLNELIELGVQVKVLGMQTQSIPSEINPGLTSCAQKAVPDACDWIINKIKSLECIKTDEK